MTTVEVVVPWAGESPHRGTALGWVVSRYRSCYPHWTVTVAETALPWCKARAVNPAVAASRADVVVVADGDSWCDAVGEAVDVVDAGTAGWAAPHWRTHRFTPAFTLAVLAGADPAGFQLADLEEAAAPGCPGGGIVVAPPSVLADVPLDPRFVGWGGEDWSWGRALRTLWGQPWRKPGDDGALWHLWHPPQARPARTVLPLANDALRRRYASAYGHPDAMRALIDEIGAG